MRRLDSDPARLVRAADVAPFGLWDWDVQAGDLATSAGLARLFGLDDTPSSVGAWLDRIDPVDRVRATEFWSAALESDAAQFVFRFRVNSAEGQQRYLEVTGHIERGEDAGPRRVYGTVTGSSSSPGFLETVLETLPTPVFVKDEREGRWIGANQAFARMVGEPLEALIGKRDRDLFSDEQSTHFERMDQEAFERGSNAVEEPITTAAGEDRWLYTMKTTATLPSQERILVGVITDITERRKNEEALLEAREEALAAVQAKSRFLANMSHEIRTPMNGVVGLVDLLAMEPLSDEGREYVNLIRNSSEALLTVINDVLDFSKLEAGKLRLDPQPFDVRRTVRGVIGLLSSSALDQGLDLEMDLASDLPPYVVGDGHRLHQALVNLVGNAIKFTTAGRVRVVAQRKAQHLLHFEVHDTGPGMSKTELSQIFKPFEQLDSSSTRTAGGTGLGLPITRGLVELMEGELQIHSRLDEGTHATLTIPLLEGAEVESAPASPPDPSFAARRALVVEDHPVNQLVARRMLEGLGLRAEVAEHGRRALEIMERRGAEFDVVLMDCQMPDLDGYETTRRIRALPGPQSRVPIIAVTAHALAGDRERCLAAGMDAYATKPLTLERFEAVLRGALEAGRERSDSDQGSGIS